VADPGFLPPLDLPVLGVPTRFLVTDAELAGLVEETFGAWRALNERPELLSPARVHVRLIVHRARGDGPSAPVQYRWPRPNRLVVTTPGSKGVADLARGDVVAHVTPELAADGAHFRHAFLSALTLATVTVHDRIPLHAAAVARGDTALLLHGPSGVGKSSLVLAAARLGLRPLSEDVVYAELGRGPRVWGMPGPVHLMEDGLRFFPDISPLRAVVRTAGATKLAVEPPGDPGGRPLVAHRAGVCLLRASAGAPSLEPATVKEVRTLLAGNTERGFDSFAREAGEAADFISGAGAWRMSVGSDPHAAASVLADLLERTPGASVSPRS
jgi:hypothetical protein